MNPAPTSPRNLEESLLDAAALMGIKLPELRVKEDWSGVWSRSQCAAGLCADAAGGPIVWRSSGFASRSDAADPGEHSLMLGTPGLYYATPLGLVCGGVDWRKVAVLRQSILVECKAEAEGLTVEKAIGRLLNMVKGETRRLK